MSGYRENLTGPLLDYAMKKYKGRRMIPSVNLALIEEQFKKEKAEKLASNFQKNLIFFFFFFLILCTLKFILNIETFSHPFLHEKSFLSTV